MKRTLLFLLTVTLSLTTAMAQMHTVGTATGANSIPFGNGTWSDQRCQFLYLPGEFSNAPTVGFITKIYFKASATQNGSTYNNFRIDMGQNNTTSLTTTWQTGLTTVYTAPAEVINTVNGTWFGITLATPFFFDPSLPLIIDSRQTSTTGAGFSMCNQNAVGNRRAYGTSGAAMAGGAGVQRYDFGFDLIPGFPCTGAPVTGTVGPSEVCPNKNFSIGFNSFYTGVNRVWQKSTDGINWVNFTGTTNPVTGALNDAITVPTYYRCILTCLANGLVYTTPAHFVNMSMFYYCYCDNAATPPPAAENKVNTGRLKITAIPGNNVRLDNVTITGAQVNNANANKDYSDFRRTIPPVKMYRDSSFRFELSQYNRGNALNAATVLAFLDYDRDGIFQDYERIHFSNSFSYGVPGEIRDSFKVSDTAHIGITGMRIIIKNGNDVPDSCGNYANGETEDYLVDIRYQPCTGGVNAGVIEASDTTMCSNYLYIVTDTTYEKKFSEMSRAWQVSADNVNWNTISGSSTKDSLMRIFHANQPFYYRHRMVCDATKDTSYSETRLINKKPAYKCYCYSQSDGGLGVDTSDLGGLRIVGFNLQQGGSHLSNPKAYYPRKDFTDMTPIHMDVDSYYVMDLYHIMPVDHHGDAKITVFIDFNNNHKYDIPQDRVFTGFTSAGTFVLTPTIHVPNNAIVGRETGMRIIVNNDIAPNAASDSACGTYASGETEDYMVIFHRKFPTNINNAENIKELQVYPNPTTGRFHIGFQHGGNVKDIHVSVTNVTGQKILSRSYTGTGNSFSEELSLEGAAPGVYFVELNADGQKQIQRLTVK